MTELFKQRVAAFQMFLDFPGPYAESIRAFMRDIVRRFKDGVPLEERQEKLLRTHDPFEIQSVLEEWAFYVQESANRIRAALVKGDVGAAFDLCQSWGDHYWRIYEHVIDSYEMDENPFLQDPYEARQAAHDMLLVEFPVNIHTSGDPLEGRLEHFEEQLRKYGNPWR